MYTMTESRRVHPERCPICRAPAIEKFAPFCSRRCADIDLHRWLGGVYAIPVTKDTDEDGTRGEDDS
jgi:endogenous inhibitor of DNA gyrase (YacG/DUF329 family)